MRSFFYQLAIVGAVILGIAMLARRAIERLAELGVHSGFGFLDHRAGFDIGESWPLPALDGGFVRFLLVSAVCLGAAWILDRWSARGSLGPRADPRLAIIRTVLIFGGPGLALLFSADDIHLQGYTPDSSFRDALLVGIANTVRVSIIAIVLATALGLAVALMRLSPNAVLRGAARVYLELVRNIPLLLHLFFWYFGVLRALPGVRQSLDVGGMVFINNRGVYFPEMLPGPGLQVFFAAVLAGGLLIYAARAMGKQHGNDANTASTWIRVATVVGVALPLAAVAMFGSPLLLTAPELKGFNFRHANVLSPEFTTLLAAMTLYHGAYAAEIIRSGIQSVPRGQVEAGRALALAPYRVLRHIVLPLAVRVVIPPMISRYLGLIKSSSLAVAIGYPEIVSIGHSIEFVTGQALELVLLTMAFYLTVSMTVSTWMNWYNARIQRTSAA